MANLKLSIFVTLLSVINLVTISKAIRPAFLQCKSPGKVAITFDDGPHPTLTSDILDVLKEKGLQVTFFVLGLGNHEWDEQRYNATIRRAFNEGHQIGSHSYSHLDMSLLTPSQIREELGSMSKRIQDLLGVNMTVFRPPYGVVNNQLMEIAQDEFNYEVIIWNVATEDYAHEYDVQAGLQHYIDAIQGGFATSFIGLHHDWPATSAELARASIDYVQANNFTVVTVAECIDVPKYQ